MGSSYFVVVLLPSPARSTNTSGKMSETEAKTDAVAEQPTAEEIKCTKRSAEEGEVEAKKQKTNGSANGADAEANGDAEEEHDDGEEEEDLDEEDIDEEAEGEEGEEDIDEEAEGE